MAPKHSTAAATPSASRQQRRRELTRSRLLEAARTLFAERGVESVGLHEVTQRADLGTGTMYNYFPSKDALVEALLSESIETVGQRLDRIQETEADPAAVFAFSLRHLVNLANEDELWGWMVVRLGVAHPQLLDILGPRANRDLRIGVNAGRFTIADVDVATACVFGALISALHLALTDSPRERLGSEFAHSMLCMVGVPYREAAEVAGRELPPLPELPGGHSG